MRPTFFSESEARSRVGSRVEAVRDFPSVPAGTPGKVVRARKLDSDRWVVRVEWRLPRKASVYFATIANLSLNYLKQSEPVTDEFNKDELERLLICSEI